MPRDERTGLFVGKSRPHDPNPEIPTPEHKERPIREQLIHAQPLPVRPIMKKERERIDRPYFNELYGTARVEGEWRYTIDNYAHGTFSSNANTQVATSVTLIYPPNWRLEQWPGGTSLYYCIRTFSIAAQGQQSQSTNINVPATAGAITLSNGPGTLLSALVTATGTTNLTFQDGAGNIIGIVPSTATVGQVFTFNAGYSSSLVANKAATTPVVTAFFMPNAAIGVLDCYYQDTLSGYTIPLGTYNGDGIGNSNIDILLPTPVSDPGLQQNIGNLLVTLSSGGQGSSIFWQIGFSGAYLLPDIRGYEIYTRGGSQRESHHTMHSELL